MSIKHISFLIVGLLLAVGLQAQAPKYSNEFLAIGVSAKAAGMSNSVVGSINDVTAGYWNPAGLARIEDNIQVSLMHAEYFAGIANYDYGAIAFKLNERSTMGISLIRFGIDDIPNTFDLFQDGQINYNRIKTFSAVDYAVLTSYATKTRVEGLSLGGSAKIVHRKVGSFATAWGFGLDLGLQYQKGKWSYGVMARDITSTFNAWSFSFSENEKNVLQITGNEIPENSLEITLPRTIIGASRQFNFGKRITFQPEIDFEVTFDGQRNTVIKSEVVSVNPYGGLELGYNDFVFLRTGIGNIQQERDFDGVDQTTFQPNIGVGLKYKSLTIDYALSDIGDNSAALYSNIFSLRLDINRKDAVSVN